jgi:hypothetical protein
MRNAKNFDAITEIRKVRNRMSVKHWNNPELFKLKLSAAYKRLNEQFKLVKH